MLTSISSYDRGWAVLALDPKSFRKKSSIEEACGGKLPYHEPNSAFDLTPFVESVPEASTRYITRSQEWRNEVQSPHIEDGPNPHLPGPNFVFGASTSVDDTLNPVSDSSEDSEHEIGAPAEVAATSGQPQEHQPLALVLSPDSDSQTEPQSAHDSEDELDAIEGLLPTDTFLVPNETASSVDEESDEAQETIDSDELSEHETDYLVEALLESIYGGTATSSEGSGSTQYAPRPLLEKIQRDKRMPEPFLEFPILHFSEGDIRMFWGQYSEKPRIIYRMVLRQTISELAPALTNRDRLNIVHQIPELGIVLAASQKGRVAILSLTEAPDGARFVRLERILPFESQERLGKRPLVPLLGVAVGPVEGNLIPVEDDESERSSVDLDGPGETEGSPPGKAKKWKQSTEHDILNRHLPHTIPQTPRESWHGSQYSRRYRVILMYLDHTVLRYELFYDWPKGILGVHHSANEPFNLAFY